MSTVEVGIGCSHSSFLNTHADAARDQAAVARFRAGLAHARQELAEARPDALVVIGSNHFRGMWLDLMPAFTVGVGACRASGEAGTPSGPLAVDTVLARHLADSLIADDFDIAFSVDLQVDHGISLPLQYLTPDLDVPIVPVIVNVFAPPLPSLRRSFEFGKALRRALSNDGNGRRVAVIASGGLSHVIPFPNWTAPTNDDERFLVDAFSFGRTRWAEFEERRRAISAGSTAVISPAFDEAVLDSLEAGRLDEFAAIDAAELVARGGNGAHELRTWLAMVGAIGAGKGRRLVYEPIEEWLTGMAVAIYEPERQ